MGPVLDGVAPVGESIEQHSPSRFATAIRCGPFSRSTHAGSTHAGPGCFCKNSTCHAKTLLVLQSQNIEQHTPGRVAVVIRCGPVLDGVAPVGGSIEQHSPSRFATAIRCGPVLVAVPSMDRMQVSDSQRRAGLQL
jgi:hypothetical protein